jgi:RNA polymerase sigma factor (sigma-70 family)
MLGVDTSEPKNAVKSSIKKPRIKSENKRSYKHNTASMVNIDSVKLISNYLNYPHDGIQYYSDPQERREHIDQWLIEYHSPDVTEDRKVYLRRCVIINLWYLFPYLLTSYHFKVKIFDDALQNLVLSILKAIDKFDPSRGTKFTAYITGYIKNGICTTIKNESLVKVPASAVLPQMIYLRSVAVQEEYSRTEGEDGETLDVIDNMNTVVASTLPDRMDDPITEDGWCTPLNINDDQNSDTTTSKQEASLTTSFSTSTLDYRNEYNINEISPDLIVNKNIPDALSTTNAEESLLIKEKISVLKQIMVHPDILSEREKLVISLRYGLGQSNPKTLDQVAEIMRSTGYKATKEWVFQIEHKSRRKIYDYFESNGLLHLVED